MQHHYWSAVQLARAIRNKDLSAEEALVICHERIASFDTKLNAVCYRIDERALQTARRADAKLASGRLGSF